MNKKILTLLLVFFLASCSSVPLSSMVKLANFDQDDLIRIDPSQVRSKITLTAPAELETKTVKLVLKFEYSASNPQEYLFSLEPLWSKKISRDKWFEADELLHQYEFKIEQQSIKAFKKYQREFLKYGKPKKYHWTVYYYLKNRPIESNDIKLDLELKFSEKDEYFYLLKGAVVDIE
ncbi:MAG: hypothetical protein OQK51_14010 [Kangiellaceae bacterium]|nr:hypothetical protein [Kangiellaceae bacterium]